MVKAFKSKTSGNSCRLKGMLQRTMNKRSKSDTLSYTVSMSLKTLLPQIAHT